MSNLIDIQSQIEKLQKQANEIKSKDFNATVHEILSKMAAFGITVKDLQSSKTGKGKAGRVAKGKLAVKKLSKVALKVSNPVAPKYRGPNGETWTGRGLTPKWLSQLISQGQAKETFLIAS